MVNRQNLILALIILLLLVLGLILRLNLKPKESDSHFPSWDSLKPDGWEKKDHYGIGDLKEDFLDITPRGDKIRELGKDKEGPGFWEEIKEEFIDHIPGVHKEEGKPRVMDQIRDAISKLNPFSGRDGKEGKKEEVFVDVDPRDYYDWQSKQKKPSVPDGSHRIFPDPAKDHQRDPRIPPKGNLASLMADCRFDLEECERKWDDQFNFDFNAPLMDTDQLDSVIRQRPNLTPIILMKDFVESYGELSKAKKSYETDSNNTLRHSEAFLDCKSSCDEQKRLLIEAANELKRLKETQATIENEIERKKRQLEQIILSQETLKKLLENIGSESGENAAEIQKKLKELEEKKNKLEEENKENQNKLKEAQDKFDNVRRQILQKSQTKQGKVDLVFEEKQRIHSYELEIVKLESTDRICLMEANLKKIMLKQGDVDISFIPPELQRYSMAEGNKAEFIEQVLKWQELISKQKEMLVYLNRNSPDCEKALLRINLLKDGKEKSNFLVISLEKEAEEIQGEMDKLEVLKKEIENAIHLLDLKTPKLFNETEGLKKKIESTRQELEKLLGDKKEKIIPIEVGISVCFWICYFLEVLPVGFI